MQELLKLAINGTYKIVNQTEEFVSKVLNEKGENFEISFPDTAYYLPFIYAATGAKIQKLADLIPVFTEVKKTLLPKKEQPLDLEKILNAGLVTLACEEVIEVLKYSLPEYNYKTGSDLYLRFTGDATLREQGIKLVDGRMPAVAVIIGTAPDNNIAKNIITQLQERNILVFMCGVSSDKKSIIDQLNEEKVQFGWDTYLVPLGDDIISSIYAVNFAARAAMSFGGIKPGDVKNIVSYIKERVKAFVIALGDLNEETVATACGVLNFNIPIVSDKDIGNLPPLIVSPVKYEEIVDKAIELRGIKIKRTKINIPVAFGAAFEGERVRKEQTYVEFGGKYSTSFEIVLMKKPQEIQNGKIELFGPDIDEIKIAEDKLPFAINLGIIVEVAGGKMQKDFESVLERQIHHYLSFAKGIFHMGQRNQNWIRISKEAFNCGFRLKHFGEILISKFIDDFHILIDKIQVKIYTDESKVKELLNEAIKVFNERDERISGLTDESVDTFYSCTLCQTFAPNHVCIITPEKLGLCGAYNWLDGKAAYEINPKGMNQPVLKGKCLDETKGEWEGINKFIQESSHGAVGRFCNYSIMEFPTTSCGCFECIIAILPECNGFMVVNRGYSGMTPCGMTFSTLAGSVGGGNQTPGFLGVGKLYLTSKKFLFPEGGLKRIVWMTKELKETLRDKLQKRCDELGDPKLLDKIADETITTDPQVLLEFLAKNNHPALSLPPLI